MKGLYELIWLYKYYLFIVLDIAIEKCLEILFWIMLLIFYITIIVIINVIFFYRIVYIVVNYLDIEERESKRERDVIVNEGLILGYLYGEKWVVFMLVNCVNDRSVVWFEGVI